MKKTDKKSDKKTFFQDCRDLLRLAYSQRPTVLAASLGSALLGALTPFVNIVYSARILDRLLAGGEGVMTLVYWMVGLNLVLQIGSTVLDWLCEVESETAHRLSDAVVSEKCLTMDYQQLEDPVIMNKKAQADHGSNTTGGMAIFLRYTSYLAANALSILFALITVSRIFVPGTPSPDAPAWAGMLNSPWTAAALLALVVLVCLASLPLQMTGNKRSEKIYDGIGEMHRCTNALNLSYQQGKDVRTYRLSGLIFREYQRLSKASIDTICKYSMESHAFYSLGAFLNTLPTLAAYAFVGLKAMAGLISVGTLTMQVSAITIFASSVASLVSNIGYLDLFRKQIRLHTEFLAIPSERYHGTLPVEKRDDGEYALEFRGVSFRYPNQEGWSLRHVSCKLPLRGKIAIVGPNGAGKTTFIKLLCRLYDPQEGQILLNGIDIKKYDYKEYVSLLSVVFQDFKLFSMKLGENVAAGVDFDAGRVWECLEKAGIRERAERMEQGLDTPLYQEAKGGVEISGGEAQKIAIARALYKDAPVVILDEPTAALDPVSEYEIYSRFGDLVENKTSIYISHRMSSCKFCDEILVFADGDIVQRGSHEDLMNRPEGLYAQLWEAQAENYKEAEEKRKRREALA